MGNVLHITDDNYETEVVQSDKITIVDFWAEWCGPCRMVGPILEELANEYDQIKITKLNVDENPKVPASFGISSIPTLFFYKDGKIVEKVVGALPKPQLLDKLKVYL